MHIEKWRGFFGFLFYLELQDAKKKMLNLVWHSQIWKKEKNTAPESHEIKQQKYVTTTKSHSWPFQARLILLKSRVNPNGWTIVTRNLPLQNWNEPTRENKTLLSLWIPSHEEDSWISIIRKMLSRMKVHPKRHHCMYVSRYFLLVQFSSSWLPYPPRKKGKWTTCPEHCVTVYPCCVFQGTPGVDVMLTNMYPGKKYNVPTIKFPW